ncbi:hypothetical protein N311_07328, partial [Apaloderma vittatum]
SASPCTGETKALPIAANVLKLRDRNSSERDTAHFQTSIPNTSRYLMNLTFISSDTSLWLMWEYV